MSIRGVPQLKELIVRYCDLGGSSRGTREFIATGLLDFARAHPECQVSTVIKRNKHPMVRGNYVAGFDKVRQAATRPAPLGFCGRSDAGAAVRASARRSHGLPPPRLALLAHQALTPAPTPPSLRPQTIGVKNTDAEAVAAVAQTLSDSSGRKMLKFEKEVYSRAPSVQGSWACDTTAGPAFLEQLTVERVDAVDDGGADSFLAWKAVQQATSDKAAEREDEEDEDEGGEDGDEEGESRR